MRLIPAALLCALTLGCGKVDHQFAAVSGRVTKDGKPLANAHVTFQPMGERAADDPGSQSYARTNANGEFTLKVVGTDRPGAVVGKHRVLLSTLGEQASQADAVTGVIRRPKDEVPDYYKNHPPIVEVPPEGVSNLRIDIKANP